MYEIRIKKSIEEKENKVDNLTFKNNSRVIEINGVEVGFYTVCFINDRLTVEYNLFSKFRNKGYGKEFVKIVVDLVEKEYTEYDSIHVLIVPSNIPSINVAKANGFGITDDYYFLEITSNEGYYLYSKKNSLYKPKEKKLV